MTTIGQQKQIVWNEANHAAFYLPPQSYDDVMKLRIKVMDYLTMKGLPRMSVSAELYHWHDATYPQWPPHKKSTVNNPA